MGKLLLPGREVEAHEEKARVSLPDSVEDLAEAINEIDQLLRYALQNPLESLTSKLSLFPQVFLKKFLSISQTSLNLISPIATPFLENKY